MNRFAELLDRLSYEPRRNAKLTLIADYFRFTPDPERGWALAAMTGSLSFANAKPGLIRTLIAERTDPVLFALSYDYVGDLSETVALMWPAPASPLSSSPLPGGRGAGGEGGKRQAKHSSSSDPPLVIPGLVPGTPIGEVRVLPIGVAGTSPAMTDGVNSGRGVTGEKGHNHPPAPTLSDVVEALTATLKPDLPPLIADWLDRLDETGRWALLKLVTGGLRIGVSARLAKTAVAALGDRATDEIEHVWHGLEPPYLDLFAWVEGRAPRPESSDPVPFRPPMLSHPLEDEDFEKLDSKAFAAEWKWDGIRVQAVGGRHPDGRHAAKLYSRSGEDISRAFPDLIEALTFDAALDGELLILREGHVQSFNVLQQRLNRKAVSSKALLEYPAHIRVYDLLVEGEEDLRPLPFIERRRRLEAFLARLEPPRFDLSPLIAFEDWDTLASARADPFLSGAGVDAEAVEGCMIKRLDSPYMPGRPKGLWFKWKRDPHIVDAVLMYAQRGHGKRSSFYSDYTFGVWRGDELVPVGKAYFGFTDEELRELDRFVRRYTVNRFGPVREVEHTGQTGLVLEIAFEGLQRSTRHKSGVAMRFPRVSRIRWDKPPAEADRLETLEAILRRQA